ncbi:MAG: CHASE2 domain-containing protein [Deltaproteobacteria bacterium]|nr:CHASE2 domain-containing protein [Deltaproteobacteria bacterium]
MKVTRTHVRGYILLIFLGLIVIFSSEYLGFFEGMNKHVYDLSFRLRGPLDHDERILLVVIDERTLNRLGRWPLRRIHYARFLDRLRMANVVGLDIIMAEPSEDDAALAAAMERQGRVVLPAYIKRPFQITHPTSLLSAAAVGHIHLEEDIDGVVRNVFHTLYTGTSKLPSFTSVIYEKITGEPFPKENRLRGRPGPKAYTGIMQMDQRKINYYGTPGTFPSISFADIVENRYSTNFFKDKIVLVGVSAIGIEGGILTPFTQQRDRMTGIECHAHILNNLLDENSIVDVPDTIRWIISAILALVGLVLFLRVREKLATLLWFLSICAASAAVFFLLALFNRWFSPLLLYTSLSFMFVVAYIFRLEQTGSQLQEAKDEWEDSFHTINDAIILMDFDCKIIRTNEATGKMLSPFVLGMIERRCDFLKQGQHPLSSADEKNRPSALSDPAMEEHLDPDTGRYYEIKSLPRLDRKKRFTGCVHVVRDITKRKEEEEEKERLQFQLLQVQKMQSVGRLAGGVAHDFNNILTAILGYSELILLRLPEKDPLRDYVKIIHEAGEKATALTRQLLAFSRKQVMEMQVVNLKGIVEGMVKILGRLIGEDVRIELRTATPVRNILADPVHMEQVLMNLAVNARDAMPQGGTLLIETADVELDEIYARHNEEVTPGSYVMLSVTDTGVGMSPEVKQRIFDPFFTTKAVGEGTGLGLSTVYGIIRQMSGHIYVYSEEGRGSVFKIYLPVCPEDAGEQILVESLTMPGGTETILIAEDDGAIRKLIADILEPLGYRVLVAASGEEALKRAETFHTGIDLLLTDVVMAGMSGKQLAQIFLARYPRIKVLFMSGYTEEIIAQRGIEQKGIAFIQKPLIPNKLAQKIREVLDEGRTTGPSQAG